MVIWQFMFSAIGEESSCKEMFDKHILQLKEQAKEKERKRKEEKVLYKLNDITVENIIYLPYERLYTFPCICFFSDD